MQIRWKPVLILLAFTLPASLAGMFLSIEIRQQSEAAAEKRRLQAVEGRMKMVYTAAVIYASEHKDRWPDANRWEQELQPYMSPGYDFTLPSPRSEKPRRVAINPRCAGRRVSDGNKILFFESVSSQQNAHDDLRSLPKTEDGSTQYHLQFVGGQAYNYPLAYCDTMRSDPNWAERNQGVL